MEEPSPSRTGRVAATGNSVPRWEVRFLINYSEGEGMSILYVGIDLAKNAFAVHGVNDAGAAELRQPSVMRAKLARADRVAAAVRDRHGSLHRRPPLGASVSDSRPHRSDLPSSATGSRPPIFACQPARTTPLGTKLSSRSEGRRVGLAGVWQVLSSLTLEAPRPLPAVRRRRTRRAHRPAW